ncbi:MAG: hypothetical protein AAF596_06045, partial [Planctomycetota bacterium]
MSDPINNAGGVTATSGLQITDNMDLDTIFMVLAIDRSQTMDKVIADMAEDMKATNDRINKLNEAMSVVRSIRPDVKADETGTATLTAEQKAALKVLNDEGIAIPSALTVGPDPNAATVKAALDKFPELAGKSKDEVEDYLKDQKGFKGAGRKKRRKEFMENLPDRMPSVAEAEKALKASTDSSMGTLKGKPGAFDSLVENIKTKIDSLSSNSQLDMIKLQGMINKRNQVIEMASNVMQKIANS